ncbi:MAG: protein-L-isoaspartate O-methyltransferase [Parcubacteria group bacterium]|jgi:protein-L-isoaspartate(D-aspartate) O-methyltransferase
MSKLVNDLMTKGYLKSDLVIDAFSEISRMEFVPRELELEAEQDIALPIGFGQTISQPLVVAFMLELLDVQRGHRVLDVGSGSGWTTSLLAYMVGSEGKVIGIERIKELNDFGKKNAEKFGFIKKGIAEFYDGDGSKGCADKAPFDRIMVSAVSYEIPQELKDQLVIGGKLVMPIRNSIIYLEKKSETEFYKEEFPGFYFVPLVID